MKRKNYKKWVALSLSAAMLAGNLNGLQFVRAADITGQNLLVNPGFENGAAGWELQNAGAGVGDGVGIAGNNAHTGSKHFFVDGSEGFNFAIAQNIEIPADGTYTASVWAACGGTKGKFGIRKADGTVLKEVDLSRGGYQQYRISDLELKRGDIVEVYVSEGTGWINGDDFEFSCVNQTGEAYDYIFTGNMVKNSEFNDGTNGWTITGGGGTAKNNGYPSGDTHYWLNGNAYMEQKIEVPYTGTYKASTWVSTSGSKGVFGLKDGKTGEVLQSANLASRKDYTYYELEVDLKKGDSVVIYVQGTTGWTNGDKFSLTFHTFEFGNMLINSDFATEEAWVAENAAVGLGKAELSATDSKIEQSFFVPISGPYMAEVEFESAENAVVSFGTEKSAEVNEAGKVQVKLADGKIGDEVKVGVTGKAVVKSITVKFDLEELNNQAPTVSDVKIEEEPELGATLNASYTYHDPDGHPEAESHYQWLVSDTEDGEYTAIEGADGKTFKLTEKYRDKYIKFQVTPVDAYMASGETEESNVAGPVYLNLVKNPGFESNTSDWKDVTREKVQSGWECKGDYRGKVGKGTTGYQTVTVPESGYYDLSAFVRYTGAENGTFGVKDAAGNVIKEVEFTAVDDKLYDAYNLSDIPLEEGMEVQIYFTAPSDTECFVDTVALKVSREGEIPAFANIKEFATTPAAYETSVSSSTKTVNVKYYYTTDLSKITLDKLTLSEGAEASVKVGDTLDLSKPFEVTVTDKEGKEEVWTIKAEEAEKKVVVHSSNQYLEDTFNWAAQKQRQFVMTGKTGPINVPQSSGQTAEYIPSYWAGYYDRTAFYTRDFVHQATGGQIAGLEEENFSMFKAFAKECTEERKWYTVWALNFDGSVYTMDYKNANNFVREVPAQFELVEKAYKQYLWSGDERYIEDEELWSFYTNVMTKYVDSHDANANGVVQEVGTGIFAGSCTYNERGRHVIEAGDAIGSQYQATLAYAAMLKARGEDAESEKWYQKAAELKKYFNDEWSVSDGTMDSEYVCAWGPNGEKYSDFSKETSWFMPMKMITEPGERNDAYIDFILENLGDGIGTTSTAPRNLEAYTYIPDMLFLYNRSDDAWKWMKYITSIKDKPHERPIQGTNGDYPEISFTFVSHTIEGMMGVEPDAGRNFIATVPRLPQEVPDVTADHIDIGNSELSLTHTGNTASSLTNVSGDDQTWEIRFYGEYPYIKISDEYVEAKQKQINGETVSYATTTVKTGETVNAEAVEKAIEADKTDLADLIDYAKSQQKDKDYPYVIPVVKNAFEAALAEAEVIKENPAVAQGKVDAAYDRLLKLVHMLDFTGNNTALDKMVQQVKNLKEELYTASTWAVFDDARTKAKNVLAEENSLQAEIDEAKVALRDAIFDLRLIPDKGQLEGLIKGAEAVNTANYTVKSATAFTAALDNAKAVFADEDATEEEVKAAEKALEEAQKNLVAKENPKEDADNDADQKVDSKVASDNGNNKQVDKAAKTGDMAKPFIYVVFAGIAAAVAAFIRKRRTIK